VLETSLSQTSTFSTIERRLTCYLRALWGQPVTFREADGPRVSIVQGAIRMPRQAPVGVGGDGVTLYRAAAAHAAAHLAHSTEPFPLGKLRPIQVALVSLIEDARIERLAWRDMPGLRRLWLPFHTARPGGIPNAVSLMARLGRALIDPNYQDEDAWVVKGREMFEAETDRLSDPSISRSIGILLGNNSTSAAIWSSLRTATTTPSSGTSPPIRRLRRPSRRFSRKLPLARTPRVPAPTELRRISHRRVRRPPRMCRTRGPITIQSGTT
jgi:hypothetical protein